mgnify:CR=1 FL=1
MSTSTYNTISESLGIDHIEIDDPVEGVDYIPLLRPLRELNPFYGKSHSKEWKKEASKRNSGKNNPMYGRKRGKECSNGMDVSGENNPMYGKKRGKECSNKRLKCPLCGMESNSSNIKVHIKKTHKQEWKNVLT